MPIIRHALIFEAYRQAIGEIVHDINSGTLPEDIDSFSALHDYVDANCYGGLCDDDSPTSDLGWDEDGAFNVEEIDRYQTLVEEWLQARALLRSSVEPGSYLVGLPVAVGIHEGGISLTVYPEDIGKAMGEDDATPEQIAYVEAALLTSMVTVAL